MTGPLVMRNTALIWFIKIEGTSAREIIIAYISTQLISSVKSELGEREKGVF
jgi:hypothetical protein